MKETISMWENTRMVVLTSITAAVYAAIMIPFKGFQIIPGFTEVRPAAAIPVTFGILFGPAGAWGSAIGNLIGDLIAMLSPASIPGFIGNFFFALVAYKLWGYFNLGRVQKKGFFRDRKRIIFLIFISLFSSLAVSFIIGEGAMMLGFFPFKVLAPIIAINNFLANLIITPFLIEILYPRVEKWGLLWEEVMELERKTSVIGSSLLIVGIAGGWFLSFYLPDNIKILSIEFSKHLISILFFIIVCIGSMF